MDYDETRLREKTFPEEPDVTSLNTGLRRTALVVLAAGTALGMTACGAGQVSQTANQVAAVDGGRGSVGELTVNDLQVIVPDNGGAARVGFVASFTGYGLGEEVTIDSVVVDGVKAQLGAIQPIQRGCSVVFDATEDAKPAPKQDNLCIEHTTATLASSDDLHIGTSVPATVSFSNGDQIETEAGVMAEILEIGEYTRPSETAAATEGH